MRLIRKLGWALCWAWLLTASSTNSQELVAGQVYSTSNLVNNTTTATDTTGTWQNIGLWNQGLPCWAPGGPVYCGPNPYFNQGSFNFSYGTSDVYQTVNINKAVPNATGIQVNGFTFGFTAKNGNGWDNGMQDYLKAYVNLYDSKGMVAAYDYSNSTNRKYDWSGFSFSETLAKAYAPTGSSAITYGFVGRDNNFWSGPYGPEIINVNFSLKYSIDPCVVNPLSSPTCSGFKDAMAKLNPSQTTTNNYSLTGATSTTTPTAMADPTKNEVTNTNVGGVQITTTGEITPIVNTPKFVRMPNEAGELVKEKEKDKTVAIQKPVLAPPAVAAPRKTNQDDGTSIALSAAQASSIEAVTVTQKTETAQQSSAPQQQVSIATVTSTARKIQQVEFTQAQEEQKTSDLVTKSMEPLRPATVSRAKKDMPTQEMAFEPPKELAPQQDEVTMKSLSGQGISIVAIPQGLKPITSFNVEVPQIQTSFAANRLSPLNSALEPRLIEDTAPSSSGTSVRRDVQNNELAAGVDLAKMAVQPIGFNDYMNLTLTDAAFYGSKEIYQNQRVVDNARAQRLLQGASDKVHREMVDSQYKLGK